METPLNLMKTRRAPRLMQKPSRSNPDGLWLPTFWQRKVWTTHSCYVVVQSQHLISIFTSTTLQLQWYILTHLGDLCLTPHTYCSLLVISLLEKPLFQTQGSLSLERTLTHASKVHWVSEISNDYYIVLSLNLYLTKSKGEARKSIETFCTTMTSPCHHYHDCYHYHQSTTTSSLTLPRTPPSPPPPFYHHFRHILHYHPPQL